jgi:nicotinamide mononucleotide adenylyltransferase
MDFDYLAFIGRFEPFHNGHVAAARHALRLASNEWRIEDGYEYRFS